MNKFEEEKMVYAFNISNQYRDKLRKRLIKEGKEGTAEWEDRIIAADHKRIIARNLGEAKSIIKRQYPNATNIELIDTYPA